MTQTPTLTSTSDGESKFSSLLCRNLITPIGLICINALGEKWLTLDVVDDDNELAKEVEIEAGVLGPKRRRGWRCTKSRGRKGHQHDRLELHF